MRLCKKRNTVCAGSMNSGQDLKAWITNTISPIKMEIWQNIGRDNQLFGDF